MRGRYNHIVSIYTHPLIDDGMGGYTKGTQVKTQEVWGMLTPVSANRAFSLGLTDYKHLYEITVAYNGTDLDESCSLAIDGKGYIVHSVIDKDDRGFWYKVIAWTNEQLSNFSDMASIEMDQGKETLTAETDITFNITFSNANYTVDGRCYDDNGNTVLYTVSNKLTTGFTVEANKDCTFEWTAILRT